MARKTFFFSFSDANPKGLKKLAKMLRKEGYAYRLKEGGLEVRTEKPDAALYVAMMASFAFEKDVRYKPLKTAGGAREFVVELF
ncbi:Uncharacterised protein [uncultured archaeon]|nr:Uncharacterised protein [uncultured archaeon]